MKGMFANGDEGRDEKAAYKRFRWHHRRESRVAEQTRFIHSHLPPPVPAFAFEERERMERWTSMMRS